MKNLMIYFSSLFFILSTLVACTPSASLSELDPYKRKSLNLNFKDLGKELPLNIYFLEDSTGSEARDVIVYLKNKAWKRVGQEDDLSILRDLINRKFIVITVDFGNDAEATSPFIDHDLTRLFNAVFGYETTSLLDDIHLEPKTYRCFMLPEGYQIATDLVFWEIDKHAVHGTLEHVMKLYNTEIVPNVPGMKPAVIPSEMVDKQGNPFNYEIKMDIIYPSEAKKKLPTFIYSETQVRRTSRKRISDDGSKMPFFQLRGYVYILMGHCFSPTVTHYWHHAGFTLDHWNGFACYTAGMRYIYANAEKYNIDTDHIGMMGISKGQYAVTRLSDPNHAGGEESKKFEGYPEGTPEPQPWQGYPSKIHAGWQGMGMGLWESEYITPDYVPTILACGENDRDVITQEGTPNFLRRLEQLDVNHIFLPMEGLGHSLSYGYDKKLGVDRYQLVIDFFDRYLKTEDKLPPAILMVTPRDSAEHVNPSSEISVHFAPVMDKESVLENQAIRVIALKDNSNVPGTWSVSHGGTKFTFVPEHPLTSGEKFQVSITTHVKNEDGIPLADEKTIKFQVVGIPEK
ncbi:MAG: Ig-like domain-containing protein [Mariniphaga sp.]|nr:Ig-like domain-containing protein [Mariniphaga sp.]